MNDNVDSASTSLPSPEPNSPRWHRPIKILIFTLKLIFLTVMLPFASILAVGCFDYQVVSLVGDRNDAKVIRARDIDVSMQTTADILRTRRPDLRFNKKIEMEKMASVLPVKTVACQSNCSAPKTKRTMGILNTKKSAEIGRTK